MSTIDPSAEGESRDFCVAFRSNSRVVVKANECWRLNWAAPSGAPLFFTVATEYVPFDDKTLAPRYLVIRSVISAKSPNEALYVGQLGATQLVSVIAFIHNAYIAPPEQWFAFQMTNVNDWRFIKQVEYEESPPRITNYRRLYQASATERFISQFGLGVEREDFLRLSRSIAIYVWALEFWSISLTYRSGHYLFMAAESLYDIAVKRYGAEHNQTRKELRAPFLVQAKSREATIPKEATPQERQMMLEMYARTGLPGYIGKAEGMLKTFILENTVFKDRPAAYIDLKDATDGLEHGHLDFGETTTLMIPHVDGAAASIRKWLIQQTCKDQNLIEPLLSSEFAMPLVTTDFQLMCKAEFKSLNPVPMRDPNLGPFQILPRSTPNANGNVLDVESLIDAQATVRDLGSGTHEPALTILAEAKSVAWPLEFFRLYKPQAEDDSMEGNHDV